MIKSNNYTLIFGILMAINFPLFYFLFDQYTPHHSISLILRSMAFFYCIGLVAKGEWPDALKKYLTPYWYFTVTYCLPFFFFFMTFVNHFSIHWMLNLLSATFFCMLILDFKKFVISVLTGATSALILYLVLGYRFALDMVALGAVNLSSLCATFIAAIIIGGVFSRKRQAIEDEVLNRNSKIKEQNDFLEAEIAKRTMHLEKALSAKKEFLGKISHEVRTPLQGILGVSKELDVSWNTMDDNTRYKYVKLMSDNSDRLKELMNNILDLSKYSAGNLDIDVHEGVNLSELIKTCISNARLLVSSFSKNITLVFDDSLEKSYLVDCDKTRITQVLTNLLNNSVKYSERGEVKVSVFAEEEYIRVSVSDQGVGVPAGEEEYIFASFVQSSRTKHSSKGNGLGVSLCREVIKQHKGDIWAQNNKDGGMTVSFRLPSRCPALSVLKEKIQDKVEIKSAKSLLQMVGSLPTILVIDDELTCRMTLELYLASVGFKVVACEDGAAGLEYLEQNYSQVDLILLDMMMPDMYGVNVLEKIRSNPKTKDVCVVIQTGLLDNEEISKARIIGIQGQIDKPYDKDDLINVIKSLVSSKKSKGLEEVAA